MACKESRPTGPQREADARAVLWSASAIISMTVAIYAICRFMLSI